MEYPQPLWDFPPDSEIIRTESSPYLRRGNEIVKSTGLPMVMAPDCPAELIQLDDFFLDQPVNFIKIDAEGAEMDILRGAERVIQRSRPLLAISAYHKPYDLFTLPLFLKSLVPSYRMALRHHSAVLWETVLYCW